MKQYSFLTIFIALLLAACEKPIDVDLPPTTTKLAVNAWLSKDKVITVWVGRSRPILATSNPMDAPIKTYSVTDAVPVLYENGTPFDTLVFQPAEYTYKSKGGKRIGVGKEYSVKVTAPGFTEVRAQTGVPSQSEIAGLTWNRKVRTNTLGEEQDEITLHLIDPAEKNYYLVSIYGAPYPSGTEHRLSCVSTNDRDVEVLGYMADPTSGANCFEATNLLLQDDNFNGGEKRIKFYVESDQMENFTSLDGTRIHRPYVEVRRITEDYFKYLKSSALYGMGDNPFAEPVKVYSNVQNGYGIFSAYTLAVDTLRQ